MTTTTPNHAAPSAAHNTKARIAIPGPPRSGQTFTALRLARPLGHPIALVDTEGDRAPHHAGLLADVHHLALTNRAPEAFLAAICAAEAGGYAVLVIDTLSRAWEGSPTRGDDDRELHEALLEALATCTCHLIVTLHTSPGGRAPVEPPDRAALLATFDVVHPGSAHHAARAARVRRALARVPTTDQVACRTPGARRVPPVTPPRRREGSPVHPELRALLDVDRHPSSARPRQLQALTWQAVWATRPASLREQRRLHESIRRRLEAYARQWPEVPSRRPLQTAPPWVLQTLCGLMEGVIARVADHQLDGEGLLHRLEEALATPPGQTAA